MPIKKTFNTDNQVKQESGEEFLLCPDIHNKSLWRTILGKDESGQDVEIPVIEEKPLTLYLNSQEIITNMTICDYPEYLAVGYVKNQNMIADDNEITQVEYEEDLGVVVVRTKNTTNFEEKLKKKVHTSGCAQGTMFADVIDSFDSIVLDTGHKLKVSWLVPLLKKINTMDSLYLTTGAIHGSVLCHADTPLVYMEDVGRHNAVDKIAGYMHMHNIAPQDKIFFTTGRLTSEMVIKCVQMQIPVLISRSGFTAWGVELARKSGLTVIGRARGKRFTVLSGDNRIEYDT